MKIKNGIVITLVSSLVFSTAVFSQAQDSILLKTSAEWRSELLKFPISFAPELDYVGYEDVRFAKGWSKKDSEEFWAYMFAWYIEEDPELTPEKIASDMEAYYDGLMQLISRNDDTSKTKLKKTLALFTEVKKGKFIGKVQLYDAFFLKERTLLNFKVDSYYCADDNRHYVLFKISPKPYSHSIWADFDTIEITKNCQ